jgi:hypothetical protein
MADPVLQFALQFDVATDEAKFLRKALRMINASRNDTEVIENWVQLKKIAIENRFSGVPLWKLKLMFWKQGFRRLRKGITVLNRDLTRLILRCENDASFLLVVRAEIQARLALLAIGVGDRFSIEDCIAPLR